MSSLRISLSSLLVITCVCMGSLNAQVAPVKLPTPKNAREVGLMRAFYDKTVWNKEVMAQDYEKVIVAIWDRLISPVNKFQTLASAPFDSIQFGVEPQVESLDWGIKLAKFTGNRELSHSDWVSLLQRYARQGFQVVETEWHHSEFVPPTDDRPAKSIFSVSIYATRDSDEAQETRYVLKGDMQIVWQAERDESSKLFHPKSIDVSGMSILRRQGSKAFAYEKTEPFSLDSTGKSELPVTIHPIILQDLNGDHLPEVSVVGANRVYWNKGDFQFEVGKLVEFPAKYVNAAGFGDFTGDGVLDLICATKNGLPRLYVGESGGKFGSPPRTLKISSNAMRNPVGFTMGDVDRDGDLDLFIGQNRVGYQTGDIPDPYYDAKDSFPSYLLLNDGKGRFQDATRLSGLSEKSTRRNFASSFVDLDDDDDLDLLLTNDFNGNDLFLNDGKGVFKDISDTLRPQSIGHGMSHSFGDYDLDGKLDFILVAMSSTTARRLDKLQLGLSQFPKQNSSRKEMGYGNRLYLRQDAGGRDVGFAQAPFNASVARTGWSWGSTTFDFDRDGDPDIYVSNGQTSGKTTKDYCTRYWCHDLYYPSQKLPKAVVGEFFKTIAPVFSGHSVSWNGYEHNALLMNVNGKGFVNVGFLMNCGSVLDSRMTVSGDIDLDGKVDLLFEHFDTINRTANLHFLKNNWSDNHHWIGFHLPSSAYGTKVEVELPDQRVLVQHYVSGHSVWAQHPNTVHFGLGSHDRIRRVKITWPSGEKTEIQQPKLDRFVVVAP